MNVNSSKIDEKKSSRESDRSNPILSHDRAIHPRRPHSDLKKCNEGKKVTNISKERLEVAKMLFIKYIDTQSIPKDHHVDIIPASINLSKESWKEFKKYALQQKYIVKRRRAKPEEMMRGESEKRIKYIISAMKADTINANHNSQMNQDMNAMIFPTMYPPGLPFSMESSSISRPSASFPSASYELQYHGDLSAALPTSTSYPLSPQNISYQNVASSQVPPYQNTAYTLPIMMYPPVPLSFPQQFSMNVTATQDVVIENQSSFTSDPYYHI